MIMARIQKTMPVKDMALRTLLYFVVSRVRRAISLAGMDF